MIKFKQKGDFKKFDSFFERAKEIIRIGDLNKYGRAGVEALRAATPKDSGETANSWSYDIIREDGKASIIWKNSNVNDGVNIAIILQYGHATGNGAYIQGIDYVNPAMKPVFDNIAESAWKEVERAL